MKLKTTELATFLIDQLGCEGIKLAIHKVAQSGSVYLYFPDEPRMGKVRIGDHKELSHLGYRWQIRLDRQGVHVDDKKGHKQFFFGVGFIGEAIDRMISYHRAIRRNSTLQEKAEEHERIRREYEKDRPEPSYQDYRRMDR